MKIKYLKLKNFAQIFSGMRRKQIEIDFSKNNNRIILLIGPNGSGKTSLMSQLQPFAYQGSLDIRNGIDIIDKENGYKEIHIENDGDLYVIKHHYIYSEKNGYTIKSNVTKNGTEMNSNGNQTSFKEIISIEFGLDLDFLKLLRLGSNVTNFIDLKSTERKNFSKELLSDIDIYLKLYKKINDDMRVVKITCKNIRDKIQKHNVIDLNSFTLDIQEGIKKLNELKKLKSELDSEIWEIQGYIKNVINNSPDEFMKQIKIKKVELRECEDSYNKLMAKLSKYTNIVSSDELKYKINSQSDMRNFLKIELNELYERKDEKELSLKNITSNAQHSGMHDRLLFIKERKESLSKYKNFKPTFNKSDMISALGLMHNLDKIHDTINSFDLKAVRETIQLVLASSDVERYVNNKIKDLDYEMHENNLKKMSLDISKTENYLIMSIPSTCTNRNCSYYIKYNSGVIDEEEINLVTLNKKIQKCECKKEYLLTILNVYKNIEYIKILINSNKDMIAKLPKDFFNFKDILKNILVSHSIYDENEFTQFINILEEFEEYNSMSNEIIDLQKEIEFFNLNKTTLENVQHDLARIDSSIHDKCMKLKSIELELEELQNSLIKSERYTVIQNEFNESESKKLILEKEIADMIELWIKINEYMIKHTILVEEVTIVNKKLTILEKELIDKDFKLRDYNTLTKELTEYEIQLDDIQIICDSLSSTKGLPLLFIKLYMDDIKFKVNELLSIVYDNELEISDFVISENDFTIPYKKNESYISDVRMCSQGEKSFISLAISFALLEKSLDKYNIMLLDEIDSTLDIKNRYKFIAILEKQLNVIRSEQCFLITHNNMFDNYPVSVIMTGDADVDNFKNIELIKVK